MRLRYDVLPREYELVYGLLLDALPRALSELTVSPLSLILVYTLIRKSEIVLLIIVISAVEVFIVTVQVAGSFIEGVDWLLSRCRERNLDVGVPGLDEGF